MSDQDQRRGMPFEDLEAKWQGYWEENKTFQAVDFDDKPKYYVLDMFPYPSGAGLHVGHPEGYTATDIMARYQWARGFNVLHPMGFDSFGLPAEQYALKTGQHPAVTTANNIKTFRRQLKSFGFAIDWDREIATSNADYYKWTQWIFLQIHGAGLAYQSEAPVNWCPALGTVLANEEVIDGLSERGGHPVVRKPMRQWVLEITAYADKLLAGLDGLDWPSGTMTAQKHWIGRSTGANVTFQLADHEGEIEVYTTRPDTLFGATYMVLSPEHALVARIVSEDNQEAVTAYVEAAARKSDMERTELAKEKSGVFTGAYALNPVSQARVPVWVADYVLVSYGTGAIMAVPAHDTRDGEFAEKYAIPVVEVVENPDGDNIGFTGHGTAINSGQFDGLSTAEFKTRITAWLEEQGLGKAAVNFKLRDWLFARQRYWGEPFPLWLDEDGAATPVDESELPVTLPEVEKYKPTETGDPPLGNASEEWLYRTTPEGKRLKRETNTMPQWAGSCWYYLRYLDPHNTTAAFDKAKEEYWMPVDLYVGGSEHAVLHLLYARFWHKVLYDLGHVTTPEPFVKLVHQGLILGEDNVKMSKSRGNVVNPDDILAIYGSDAFRVYEMFMGPLEVMKPWQTSGLVGVKRFLDRIWMLFKNGVGEDEPPLALRKKLHKTIKKVTEDIEAMRFNTGIAAMMELVNDINKMGLTRSVAEPLVQLLAPFAPHVCEELWVQLGHEPSVAKAPWPTWDEALCVDDTITYAVQIKGKLRGTFDAARDADKAYLEATALAIPNVVKHLEGKTIRKVIVVPGKMVSIVA